MTHTDISREQARQDNGQFGTQPLAEGGVAHLVPARPLHIFTEGEGACWKDPFTGQLHGVRIVEDTAAQNGVTPTPENVVTVRRGGTMAGELVTARRDELVGVRPPVGVETPVDQVNEGDWIMHEGQITEVGEVDGDDDEDHDEDGRVLYLTDLDESAFIAADDTVTVVDCSDRYISTEEGLAYAPGRLSEDAFRDQYGVIEGPDGDTFEEVPAGTPENQVWSHYEGELDDGRYDYCLIPGYASGALNYVVTEKPWDTDDSDAEVNWN